MRDMEVAAVGMRTDARFVLTVWTFLGGSAEGS